MGHRSWNDVRRLQYVNCTERATKQKIIMVKILKIILLIKN